MKFSVLPSRTCSLPDSRDPFGGTYGSTILREPLKISFYNRFSINFQFYHSIPVINFTDTQLRIQFHHHHRLCIQAISLHVICQINKPHGLGDTFKSNAPAIISSLPIYAGKYMFDSCTDAWFACIANLLLLCKLFIPLSFFMYPAQIMLPG